MKRFEKIVVDLLRDMEAQGKSVAVLVLPYDWYSGLLYDLDIPTPFPGAIEFCGVGIRCGFQGLSMEFLPFRSTMMNRELPPR